MISTKYTVVLRTSAVISMLSGLVHAATCAELTRLNRRRLTFERDQNKLITNQLDRDVIYEPIKNIPNFDIWQRFEDADILLKKLDAAIERNDSGAARELVSLITKVGTSKQMQPDDPEDESDSANDDKPEIRTREGKKDMEHATEEKDTLLRTKILDRYRMEGPNEAHFIIKEFDLKFDEFEKDGTPKLGCTAHLEYVNKLPEDKKLMRCTREVLALPGPKFRVELLEIHKTWGVMNLYKMDRSTQIGHMDLQNDNGVITDKHPWNDVYKIQRMISIPSRFEFTYKRSEDRTSECVELRIVKTDLSRQWIIE